MRKRLLAMVMAVVLCATCMMNLGCESKAEDMGEEISFSELLTEQALVGYPEYVTMGVYYASGYSIINKISSVKIGAGGVTNATTKCKVAVTAIVEKLDGGMWVREASWTTSVASGYSAGVSKSLTVKNGYYYRVRCTHYAATDVAYSFTSSLWM